jgi:tRNA pseudouridine38-40 synthase
VHALAMAAHVDIAKTIAPLRLADGINAKLRPLPVAILSAGIVEGDFHARFSCIGRRYLYRIVNRRAPLALDAGRAWRVPAALDAEAMNHAAAVLVGHHDFTTFRSAHCQSESPVKTLDRLIVRRTGETIEIEAAARSFLHHQVRSMVGCLELVGRGKWTKEDLEAALEAKDRAALGFNAPPDGLYFVEATYPER